MCEEKSFMMVVDRNASDFVRQSYGAITVESQNPKELARVTERLGALDRAKLTQLGENSRKYYCEYFLLAVGKVRPAETCKRLQ
jgi:hypothetical protein